MGSLNYKTSNNKMPTPNPKPENEKKKTTQKKNQDKFRVLVKVSFL
jgi:hypothetical protein